MDKEKLRKGDNSNPSEIRAMFDDIAPTYDILNHLMSFGLDLRWRKRALRCVAEKRGGDFLDIATGSGDLSFDALTLRPRRIIASDFAFDMLRVFDRKSRARGADHCIPLISCDALRLPFRSGSFDVAMVAFGIRNFADRPASLREMLRVLHPGGLALILELTEPGTPVMAALYRFYSRFIVPPTGQMISNHRDAYRYLPLSISNFPPPEEFLSMMERSGFAETSSISLTFGIATAFIGRRPS